MSWVDRLKGVFEFKKEKPEMKVDPFYVRPVDSYVGTATVNDVARIPMLPFNFRFCYDMYYYSDILRTVIRALTWETVRNGLMIVPKWEAKCQSCEEELSAVSDVCPVCGSDKIVKPNTMEKRVLKQWLERCNTNNENLIDVLLALLTDINVTDNAFVVVIKEYEFNGDGEVESAKVKEILRGSNVFIKMIINSNGKMGMTDDGRVVMTCLMHRDRAEYVPVDMVEEARCQVCGKKMYVAHYVMHMGTGLGSVRATMEQGKTIYYTAGEVLHVKKFTSGIGYGFSPVMSIWMKLMVLMKMDYFVLTSYHLQRTPKGILILRGNRESIAKAWKDLEEKARLNPNMVYPLAVEGTDLTASKRVAEWIDMTVKSQEIDFIAYREELRRTIGALYGVQPIFQGDLSTGAGLTNQGLQITVTNRAVEMEQRLVNEKILKWICEQLGVSDWLIQLKPHEEKDLQAQIHRELMRIQKAERLVALGYKAKMKETEDGIDFDFEEGGEISQEEIRQRARARENARLEDGIINEEQFFEGEPIWSGERRTEQRVEGEPMLPSRRES